MQETQVGVKALIENNGKILLLKRSNKYSNVDLEGVWDIPGGRINFGEEPSEGLRREVFEETGLEIITVSSILDASTIYVDDKKHIVRLTYSCNTDQSLIRLSGEHTDYNWIKPMEIDFKLKDHLVKKVIQNLYN